MRMYWCITCVWMYWCITHQMICSLHNDSLPLPNTRTIAPWQQNDHTDGTIADCSFLYVGRNEHIYIPYIQIYHVMVTKKHLEMLYKMNLNISFGIVLHLNVRVGMHTSDLFECWFHHNHTLPATWRYHTRWDVSKCSFYAYFPVKMFINVVSMLISLPWRWRHCLPPISWVHIRPQLTGQLDTQSLPPPN